MFELENYLSNVMDANKDGFKKVNGKWFRSFAFGLLYQKGFNSQVSELRFKVPPMRSYVDRTLLYSLIRKTGEAGNRSCNP